MEGYASTKRKTLRASPLELDKLDEQNLIEWSKNGVPRIKKFADEHKAKKYKMFGNSKTLHTQFIQQKKTPVC